MAQQVVIAGAMFNDVPAISVPDANNVYHSFLDTTITSNAAQASDIASGKLAYVNGSLVTGTGSGGSDRLVKLKTANLGTISTSTTSPTDTGLTVSVSGINPYQILIAIAHVDTAPSTGHIATVSYILLTAASGLGTADSIGVMAGKTNYRNLNGVTQLRGTASGAYGIYINSGTTPASGSTTLTIYKRYNTNYTGSINNTYTLDVYGCNFDDLF